MADRESVLISNLTEALKRSERYLMLGLISSAALAVLTFLPADAARSITLPGLGLPALPQSAATAVLIAVALCAPFMASFALSRVTRIVIELSSADESLTRAALTFPCIATTRAAGPRLIVSAGPPVLSAIAYFGEGAVTLNGVFGFVVLLVAPYAALWWFSLRTAVGGQQPDGVGD